MNDKKQRLETMVLHAGLPDETPTGSRTIPLYRISSYLFRDTQHAADLFALKEM